MEEMGWGGGEDGTDEMGRRGQWKRLHFETSILFIYLKNSNHGSRREEIGMVAALLEVHHHIEQRDSLCSPRVKFLKVLGQHPAIIFPVIHTHIYTCINIINLHTPHVHTPHMSTHRTCPHTAHVHTPHMSTHPTSPHTPHIQT